MAVECCSKQGWGSGIVKRGVAAAAAAPTEIPLNSAATILVVADCTDVPALLL